LYAYSVTKIQVPTFYALGDARTPVVASATAVGVKIATSFALISLLPRIGLEPFLGLALSTSLAAWINFALLSRALRARVGPLEGQGVVSSTVKLAALAGFMGVACAVAIKALERAAGGGGTGGEILRLGTVIVLGVAIAAGGSRLLRIPEATALLSRFRRRRTP
jgi:putative peptidoglycan lipid II flippase